MITECYLHDHGGATEVKHKVYLNRKTWRTDLKIQKFLK